MDGAKPVSTPMSKDVVLPTAGSVEVLDVTQFRKLVGLLQYLSITCPDIAYAVNRLSQFMHAPGAVHWQAAKHLLRYLKGTCHYGLVLRRSTGLQLTAFVDSVGVPRPLTLFCDNIGATYVCRNPVFHSKMKHLALDYFFVREKVADGSLYVCHTPSKSQIADALTKPLGRAMFLPFRSKLGVSNGSTILQWRIKD
ncbi:PREDICTED: uncharacterized protein LOC109183925 [Ipomoea nil]|uniref:uncharacterized protein LOC109183925 n=1 Tax=Ipomoea nil TaxID=35883 RepID=UPI0009009177|nr:PREDICTED: uncharacterized protein LOC109183925 [Ipomoea nil]